MRDEGASTLSASVSPCRSKLSHGRPVGVLDRDRFRFLTRGLGPHETSSAGLLSLLMFMPEYLQPVIRIGESDVEARLDEIAAFLTD